MKELPKRITTYWIDNTNDIDLLKKAYNKIELKMSDMEDRSRNPDDLQCSERWIVLADKICFIEHRLLELE